VTAAYVEIDPEGIKLPPPLENRALVEAVSLWHIVDAERALTWCGQFLSPGSERRLFSDTPEERRCQTCIGRFGHDVVQDPVI
jgi:hypothetical protein